MDRGALYEDKGENRHEEASGTLSFVDSKSDREADDALVGIDMDCSRWVELRR